MNDLPHGSGANPTPTSANPHQPAHGESPPAGEVTTIPPHVHAVRWRILAVLCASLILVVAANAGLNVGLASIVTQLGASQTQLQWLVDMFILTLSGLLMPMGAIGDRYGRKKLMLIGLAIYTVVSAGAFFATTINELLAIRAFMGVGASIILPTSLSLITTAFVGKERALAIAIWSGFAGAGAGIGLITSGTLLLFFNWNAIFLINVPLALIAFLFGSYYLVEAKDPSARPVDYVGSALVMVALWTLLFAIIEVPIRGFSPLILGSVGASFLLWVLFVLRLRHSDAPLIDLGWFKDPRFFLGATSISMLFFALMGWFFLVPQYVQYLFGFTAFQAAILSVILSMTQVIFAHKAAFWMDRIGTKWTVVFGMTLVIAGTGLITFLPLTQAPLWPFILAQLLIGLGMPWASSPATSAVLDALPANRVGAGSAVNGTVREIGAALGIAVTGSIMTAIYRANLPVEYLPSSAKALAQSSFAGAQSVAHSLPNPDRLISDAGLAFAKGFQGAMATSTIMTAGAIVLVLILGFDAPKPKTK